MASFGFGSSKTSEDDRFSFYGRPSLSSTTDPTFPSIFSSSSLVPEPRPVSLFSSSSSSVGGGFGFAGTHSTSSTPSLFTTTNTTAMEKNVPTSTQSVNDEIIDTEQVIKLKVMVEKKKGRVVFAESSKDFIDLIFSFLTLPIGTILRLQKEKSPPTVIGCMNNLYQSVENLDARLFKTEPCKEMLLRPRKSSEAQFGSLKLKFESNLELIKQFYLCQNLTCKREGNIKLSEFPNVHCHCGQVMKELATVSQKDCIAYFDERNGVFIKAGEEMFLISDDFRVSPGSTSTGIMLLKKLNILHANELEGQIVNVEPEEVLQLLRLSILSKTPLTHWISLQQSTSDLTMLEPDNIPKLVRRNSTTNESKKMTLKLFISKSRKNVLYAESQHDFIDFLFSFLTFPLGSILKLLDGKLLLGCVDNLYQSVNDLSTDNYLRSEELKDLLLCPKLAPHFSCDNQLLHIEESSHPQYMINFSGDFKTELFVFPSKFDGSYVKGLGPFSVVNPKFSAGEMSSGGGFVKGTSKFMVTDDLVVTILSPISSISYLGELNVPFIDIDEIVVGVGEEEALNLLNAALISKTALTHVFMA